jgi:hypothetical protein
VSKTERNLDVNGNDISFKQFIYLDRNRLKSYSSQISDGIIQLRRLTENNLTRITENPAQVTREQFYENSGEGEVKIAGVGGKTTNKRNRKKTFSEPTGAITSDEESQSLSEDKIDYDNAYLTFERQLTERGILTEIDENFQPNTHTPIIKAKGISRFFDWEAISSMLNSELVSFGLANAFNNTNEIEQLQQQQLQRQLNVASQAVNIFSIGAITFHAHIGELNLLASLNPDHLCVTRDQLRAIYVMPGDAEMTVVGFLPNRTLQPTVFPGIAGQLNMIDLWGQLVGEVDLVIDPIAIYA